MAMRTISVQPGAVILCIVATVLLVVPGQVIAWNNGQALTPPMGWNSWNRFACGGINEQVVRDVADAIVNTGMRDAGYVHVNIDDCWSIGREPDGTLIADPAKFPSGIPALADYVHARGLKLGIYSDAGTGTCANRPGSKDHEYQDAQTFADWGIDYIKHDWCNTSGMNTYDAYTTMRDAIAATGRPIVFSICEWGISRPWEWAEPVGNLWRTTFDILDEWPRLLEILDVNAELYPYAGPGHWNDPDMLEVGNGHMTNTEYRSHFSLWCIMAAPLIAGNDITNMDQATRDILMNTEAIAVDQDPLGIQGRRISDNGDHEIFMKPLANNEIAVVMFNRGGGSAGMTVNWSDLGLLPGENMLVRDLWEHADKGTYTNSYSATVNSHDVVMLRISPPLVPAPSDLQANIISTNPFQIQLTWTDNSHGDEQEQNFIVQRRPWQGDDQWYTLSTLPADTTSYTDEDQLYGYIQYTYRVGALGE